MSDALSPDLIFRSRELYERAGDFDDIVYPCGWVVVGDEIHIYCKSADISYQWPAQK